MKIDFPYGQVPIIFDEDSAIKCKKIIDNDVDEKNQHIEKRNLLIRKTTCVVLFAIGLFIVSVMFNRNQLSTTYETLILMSIGAIIIVCLVYFLFPKGPLGTVVDYPESVKFLMLKENVNISKAVITSQSDNPDYYNLNLYWIDENDEIHRHVFYGLERKYKQTITMREVDMNKYCVYEPLVMGVPFSEKPNPKEYTK